MSTDSRTHRVAVVKWADDDGTADAIEDELVRLAHQPVCFRFDEEIPAGADVVFSFAPYGKLLQIPRQLATMPVEERPIWVHWNYESIPSLRLPWMLMSTMGTCRSWVGRLNDPNESGGRTLAGRPPFSWIDQRMHKYRFLGDNLYACRNGWMDVFVEASAVQAQLYRQHGVPAIFVPWGTSPNWYANLNLERDIDVLWMGKRRTKRRSALLDQVRKELAARGAGMYVADDMENPFIFGEMRTQFLNRAKITLNLLPTWHDVGFQFRFHIAAGNRSFVVSESTLPHSPAIEAGKHYASASAETLTETILHYLEHEAERYQIVENAYQLITTTLTLGHSVKTIMDAADAAKARRS
jgi:hypothetical protein